MPDEEPPSLLYVVYWKSDRVLKVGRANHMGRVRKHLSTGADALVLIRERTRRDEAQALILLGREFKPAFARWRDATWALGPAGAGYGECFTVAPGDLRLAVDLVLLGVGDRGVSKRG